MILNLLQSRKKTFGSKALMPLTLQFSQRKKLKYMKFKGNHKYQEIQSIKLVAIKTKK